MEKPNPYEPWPPAVTAENYNDELAVRSYLKHFHGWFMTDFERRCLDLGHQHRKMLGVKQHSFSPTILEDIRREEMQWNAAENADVREALGNPAHLIDLNSAIVEFSDRVNQRIENAILTAEITVNRCPQCNRVVRTPTAKQCMWCKHDWH